jgi:CBS domain-containing protein
MTEVAEYLTHHDLFEGLPRDALDRIARNVEIEAFAAGETVFEQGQTPAERVRLVVSGSIELRDRGRTLDLLGPGELFGHPSMLAGLPTGMAARAYEDSLCYRLPDTLLLPLLTRPEGLRFVARSLLSRPTRPRLDRDTERADPASRPVAAFIREQAVICSPEDTIRAVARRMVGEGASCAMVDLGEGEFGIVTDQDLRVRVVAGDVALDDQIYLVMTAPAYTVSGSQLGADVMLEMIDRGIRHVPVLSPRRAVLGVVSDIDLLASDVRTPFMVRREISRARGVDELIAAGRSARSAIIDLHAAHVAPLQLCGIISAFADALVRRAWEIVTADVDGLPALRWVSTGSVGRREAFPSSDVDSAVVWVGRADGQRIRGFAGEVLDVVARCGFAVDAHAASAAHPLFARSVDDWRGAIERWFDKPDDERLLMMISLLSDAHAVFETGSVPDSFAELDDGPRHPMFMAQLRRLALAYRPPTGFMRNIVVEHSGEHRGRLDLKLGGFLPIVNLARYLALATGSAASTTVDRLHAAADADALTREDATSLAEAFQLFVELRMDHQVRQLRSGEPLTDFIDPASLNPLLRRYLREAFRAISRVQRRLPSWVAAREDHLKAAMGDNS